MPNSNIGVIGAEYTSPLNQNYMKKTVRLLKKEYKLVWRFQYTTEVIACQEFDRNFRKEKTPLTHKNRVPARSLKKIAPNFLGADLGARKTNSIDFDDFLAKIPRFLQKSRYFVVGRGGFEPPKSLTSDLQSDPFGRSGIYPCIYNFSYVSVEPVTGIEPATC